MTFTLQNDPVMSSSRNAYGSKGSGLGVYSSRGQSQYVKNALSLEFDTYYNGDYYITDSDLSRNNEYGHVSFVRPNENNNSRSRHSNVNYSREPLAKGRWRQLSIRWENRGANAGVLKYYLDNCYTGEKYIDNISQQFANQYSPNDPWRTGQNVYWGFTVATGEEGSNQAVAISSICYY